MEIWILLVVTLPIFGIAPFLTKQIRNSDKHNKGIADKKFLKVMTVKYEAGGLSENIINKN